MSEQTEKPSNITFMIGMIATIMIVGSVLMYVTISSPQVDVDEIIDVITKDKPEEKVTMNELNDDIDRLVRDIQLDVDGKRVVERDADGLPVISCTPFESDDYLIDEHCEMTFK